MNITAIIPARYCSSRFEGKPLADILGKPMIWWVYQGVLQSKRINNIYIATEDERVKHECEKYQMPVVMTSNAHRTPNDRVCEVMKSVKADIYVVILGDEPLIKADAVDAVIPSADMMDNFYVSNLVSQIKNPAEVVDYTNNKIVTNDENIITYASRTPIPYPKGMIDIKYRKILGISAMRREALEFYENTHRSEVEIAEEIDLLRWVQNGKKVFAIDYDIEMLSVDTPKDLEKVREILKERRRSYE